MKFPSIVAGLGLLLYTISVQAQPAILQSPSVAKASVCMNKMVEDGKNRGFSTERRGGIVIVLNPTRKELLPSLLSMVSCFNAAFPKKAMIANPENNVRSRVWYVLVDDYYAWCATPALKDTEDALDTMEFGERRGWYRVTIMCEINDSIQGFYKPK